MTAEPTSDSVGGWNEFCEPKVTGSTNIEPTYGNYAFDGWSDWIVTDTTMRVDRIGGSNQMQTSPGISGTKLICNSIVDTLNGNIASPVLSYFTLMTANTMGPGKLNAVPPQGSTTDRPWLSVSSLEKGGIPWPCNSSAIVCQSVSQRCAGDGDVPEPGVGACTSRSRLPPEGEASYPALPGLFFHAGPTSIGPHFLGPSVQGVEAAKDLQGDGLDGVLSRNSIEMYCPRAVYGATFQCPAWWSWYNKFTPWTPQTAWTLSAGAMMASGDQPFPAMPRAAVSVYPRSGDIGTCGDNGVGFPVFSCQYPFFTADSNVDGMMSTDQSDAVELGQTFPFWLTKSNTIWPVDTHDDSRCWWDASSPPCGNIQTIAKQWVPEGVLEGDVRGQGACDGGGQNWEFWAQPQGGISTPAPGDPISSHATAEADRRWGAGSTATGDGIRAQGWVPYTFIGPGPPSENATMRSWCAENSPPSTDTGAFCATLTNSSASDTSQGNCLFTSLSRTYCMCMTYPERMAAMQQYWNAIAVGRHARPTKRARDTYYGFPNLPRNVRTQAEFYDPYVGEYHASNATISGSCQGDAVWKGDAVTTVNPACQITTPTVQFIRLDGAAGTTFIPDPGPATTFCGSLSAPFRVSSIPQSGAAGQGGNFAGDAQGQQVPPIRNIEHLDINIDATHYARWSGSVSWYTPLNMKRVPSCSYNSRFLAEWQAGRSASPCAAVHAPSDGCGPSTCNSTWGCDGPPCPGCPPLVPPGPNNLCCLPTCTVYTDQSVSTADPTGDSIDMTPDANCSSNCGTDIAPTGTSYTDLCIPRRGDTTSGGGCYPSPIAPPCTGTDGMADQCLDLDASNSLLRWDADVTAHQIGAFSKFACDSQLLTPMVGGIPQCHNPSMPCTCSDNGRLYPWGCNDKCNSTTYVTFKWVINATDNATIGMTNTTRQLCEGSCTCTQCEIAWNNVTANVSGDVLIPPTQHPTCSNAASWNGCTEQIEIGERGRFTNESACCQRWQCTDVVGRASAGYYQPTGALHPTRDAYTDISRCCNRQAGPQCEGGHCYFGKVISKPRMEYSVNTNVNGRLMRFKLVSKGGIMPGDWKGTSHFNEPGNAAGEKIFASASILGGCRLNNPITCPTAQSSQRRRSLLSSNRRRVLGLAPPVGGPVLQVAPPRAEDFTQREHAASKCSHTRDCFASAPVPALCVRPDVELDPPANIVWCDACPSRHGQAPRRRSCVKDVCTCARAEPTGVLLGLEADAALRANISAIPWSGNSMCDQLMRLLGVAPNLGDLHPAERVLYMDCLSSRLTVMRFAATTGWDLPIDLMYSSEASLQYSIDMLIGVFTYISMTVLRNHTLYDVWGVLQGRGINPVSVLDWVNMFSGITNMKLPGLAERVSARLDQLAANYSGTPMAAMTNATSRAVRNSAQLIASATSPLRRVVHGSAMRSVVHAVGSAYGPESLAPDGAALAVRYEDMPPPPRTPSRVILQYALMRATTSGAIEPPPATTLRACPHAVGPGGRQLQWSFESNTPPGPTSSCFLIDWIVYDIVQAVRATMEYYRNILPRVSSRFTWVTQTYPTTPEPPQYPAIQPPSNATGCFPTRNVTNVVNGMIYAAEWVSIPVCTAVQFFEQLINNTKSNRTVFDDVALAIGCDINRIQQCTCHPQHAACSTSLTPRCRQNPA